MLRFKRMPKTLLVADDSLTIRKVIGMVLALEDFQLTSVDNGIDAIARAREMKPDLVLADVLMPGRSGYEVCEALKSDPSTSHVPVLLLSGNFEPFDEGRARAARADGHLTKPFESQALLDKVRALLGLPAGQPMLPPRPAMATPAAPASSVPRPSQPMSHRVAPPPALPIRSRPSQRGRPIACVASLRGRPSIGRRDGRRLRQYSWKQAVAFRFRASVHAGALAFFPKNPPEPIRPLSPPAIAA